MSFFYKEGVCLRHVIFNEKEYPFEHGFLNTRKLEQQASEFIHLFPLMSQSKGEGGD